MNQIISSELNRTPIVQIVTWFTLVASLLAFCTHAGINFYVFRSLKTETWFVLGSLVFSIAQSIAVSLQTHYGYGTPMASLSDDKIDSIMKSEYAATILLIISLCFSKLAIVAFIHHLTPFKMHRMVNFGLLALIVIWSIGSVLVAAFECRLPRPWDRALGQCLDYLVWWTTISVSNIVTEVAIVALELGITAQLRMQRQRKASVMSLFACRLLVLAAAAAQLGYFRTESQNAALKEDLTLGYWRSCICNQILQCLAIVTTCLPYTKLFMEGFDSGLFRLNDLRMRGKNTPEDDSRGYHLMDVSRSGQSHQSDSTDIPRGIRVSKSWAVQVDPVGQKHATSH